MPDIGQLFPDNDPKWRGADSAQFMEEAVRCGGLFCGGFNVQWCLIFYTLQYSIHTHTRTPRHACLPIYSSRFRLMGLRGYRIGNVDVTLILQKPKVRPSLPLSPSVCLCVCLSVPACLSDAHFAEAHGPSVPLLPVCLSVSLPVCLSACLPVCLTCLSVCLPVYPCLSVCLTCLSVYLACFSDYLSVCLSASLFVSPGLPKTNK